MGSIRLKDWNYARRGYYFVTICVQDRRCLLGEVKDGKMIFNKIGEMVFRFWQEIPNHFKNVEIDEFVIMPNHVHGIVVILSDDKGVLLEPLHATAVQYKNNKFSKISPKPKTLSTIIRSFKSVCTREIHKKYPHLNFQWQSLFYDHIIRNQQSLENIQKYIYFNPDKWIFDQENPRFIKKEKTCYNHHNETLNHNPNSGS